MKEEIPQLMLEKNKVYSKIMRRVSSPMGIITDTNIMKYSNIHNNLHKPSSNHQKSSSLLIGGSKQSAALKRQIMSYAPSSDISLISKRSSVPTSPILKNLNKTSGTSTSTSTLPKLQQKRLGDIYKHIFNPDSGDILMSLKDQSYLQKRNESKSINEDIPFELEETYRMEDKSIYNEGISNLQTPQFNRKYLSKLSSSTQIPVAIDYDKLRQKILVLQKGHMKEQTNKKVENLAGKLHLQKKLNSFVETGDPHHLFYCSSCPHCRLKDGEMYKFRTRFKRPLFDSNIDNAFFDFFQFFDQIVSNEKFHTLMDTKSDLISTKLDMMIFNNVIQNLLEGELKLTEIFDEHFLNTLRSSKLYQGQSMESDYNNYIKTLRKSDASDFRFPMNDENCMMNRQINSIYQKYYKKYAMEGNSSGEMKSEGSTKDKFSFSGLAHNRNVGGTSLFGRHAGTPLSKKGDNTPGVSTPIKGGTPRTPRTPRAKSIHKNKKRSATLFMIQPEGHNNEPKSVFERFYIDKLTNSHRYKTEIMREDDEDINNCILYIGIQEIIRQLAANQKDKGYLLLSLFKKYFGENERRWFKIINNLQEEILKLKHEQEYLLAKYFTDMKEMNRILNNNSATMDNLLEHKRMLRVVLGSFYSEESKRIIAESKASGIEKDIKKWLMDWDIVKTSPELNEKFNLIDDSQIQYKISLHEEYRTASREELILLKNAERFLMAVPYKNHWELDIGELENELKQCKEENQILSHDKHNLQQLLKNVKIDERLSKMDLRASKDALNYAYRQIEVRSYKDEQTQTEINMKDAEYLANTKTHLLKKREKEITTMKKLVNQINHKYGLENLKLLPEYNINIIMEGCYTQLLKLVAQAKDKLRDIRFDEVFYMYIKSKYGLKSVAKEKSMEILFKKNELIELFGNFLGIGKRIYGDMILNFYASIILSTGESINTIITVNSNKYLTYLDAKDRLSDILCNCPSLLFDIAKKNLAVNSKFFVNNEEQRLNIEEKFKILYLQELQAGLKEKNMTFTKLLEKKGENMGGSYRIQKLAFVKLVVKYLSINISDTDCIDFVDSCFANYQEKDYVYLTDINKAYSKSLEMKVPIKEYLRTGIDVAIKFEKESIVFLKKLEEKIPSLFATPIDREEFARIILRLLPDKPRWQIMSIYQNVIDFQGLIIYEEFLYEILRNPLLRNYLDASKSHNIDGQ